MNPDFAKDLPRQLRFWALHVPLNALPSFIIAISLFRFDKHPNVIVTMLAAIGIFIIGLAATVAMVPDLNRDDHPLARGLRAAVTFRAWVSGLSAAMLVLAPPSLPLIPDFWCGYLAAGVVEETADFLHLQSAHVESGGFVPVLLTTIVEGAIIATALAMLAFFLSLYFQCRDRRKAFISTASPAPLRR